MKKINNKNIWCLLDILAIIIALSALVCNLIPAKHECLNNTLCIIAGAIGFYYFATSVLILIFNRPKFDWHLVNGNYLGKVVALVLLFPSIIASCFLCYNCSLKDGEYSPKNLVYDENLYSYNNVEKNILGTAGCEYFTESVFLSTHNLELGCDSIIIQKNKLPQTIISKQEDPSIFWTVYYHFIDPGNQHMTTSQSGRGWAALIGILGVFLLNGLLVSSIIGWIDSRKEKWLKGEVKYPCFLRRKKHSVIIGGNDMAFGIVRQIMSEIGAIPYILIQTTRDVEEFRRELFSTLTKQQQQHIIIFYGNRTSTDDIKDLILESAEEVYILGEDTRTDDIESYHDTMNMKCLELVSKSIKDVKTINKDNKLTCCVMFEYQTTFSVFQFYDMDKNTSKYISFKPFNYYEMWAQRILVNQEINETKLKCLYENGGYLPLEGYKGIRVGDNDYVHLFIVGISRMGMAMAIEAAHLAHYPNYTEEKKIRTKITFIDKNAKEEKDFFMGRFKELFALSHWRYGALDENSKLVWLKKHIPVGYKYLGGDFLDIEWEFINGGIVQTSIQDYILSSATPSARVTIAICLPESNRSHAAALYLHKKIYESDSVLQVLVYNRYGNSIIQALQSNERVFPYLNKIKSFGEPRECLSTRFLQQSENIGVAIGGKYEEIRQKYILKALEKAGQQEGKGGYNGKSATAKSWSNVYNGITMWTKLRSISYVEGNDINENQKELLSNVEHNRWNIEQLLMNFRPLTKQEQDDVINKKRDKEDLKKQMAHLNICSNKRLDELKDVDVAARAYDKGLTELIPKILKDIKCQTNK